MTNFFRFPAGNCGVHRALNFGVHRHFFNEGGAFVQVKGMPFSLTMAFM